MSQDFDGYVYVLKAHKPFDGVYKIGRTIDPEKRLREFGVKLPYKVEPVLIMRCIDYKGEEKGLHERFADKRLDGEWFRLTDTDIADIWTCHLAWQAWRLVCAVRGLLAPDEDWHEDLRGLLRGIKRAQHVTRVLEKALRRLDRRWAAFDEAGKRRKARENISPPAST